MKQKPVEDYHMVIRPWTLIAIILGAMIWFKIFQWVF